MVVIGGRYGSTDSNGMSFTEREYRYAVERGVPVAAFLHGNPADITAGRTESDPEKREKLDAFRMFCRQRLCKEWNTPHELGAVVSRSVTQLIRRNPRPGWVRADALASEEATRQLLQLKQVIEEQATELQRLSSTSPHDYDSLAQGTDPYSLNVRITMHRDAARWGDPDRLHQVELRTQSSWDELFTLIAPRIIDGGTEQQVRGALHRGLKDKLYRSLVGEHPGNTPKSASIQMSDVNTILLQFVALDLIEVKTEILEGKNGPKERRTWHLTPRGKKYMFQTLAVRRTIEPDHEAEGR